MKKVILMLKKILYGCIFFVVCLVPAIVCCSDEFYSYVPLKQGDAVQVVDRNSAIFSGSGYVLKEVRTPSKIVLQQQGGNIVKIECDFPDGYPVEIRQLESDAKPFKSMRAVEQKLGGPLQKCLGSA